jgi:hypothetical protein
MPLIKDVNYVTYYHNCVTLPVQERDTFTISNLIKD